MLVGTYTVAAVGAHADLRAKVTRVAVHSHAGNALLSQLRPWGNRLRGIAVSSCAGPKQTRETATSWLVGFEDLHPFIRGWRNDCGELRGLQD